MKKELRRASIKEYIQQQGYVSFQQLRSRFPDYSEMTLRSDLKALDAENLITRVHGGATAIPTATKSIDLFFQRTNRRISQKQAIAYKAAKLVRPYSSVFFDCGTTTTELARVFPDEPISIVTNSVSCAIELARLKNLDVTLLGGTLNRYNLAVDSHQNMLQLERMNFDIMFLAVSGYSPETGFTCGTEVEDAMRRTVINHSSKVVALMDSSKVGVKFTVTYASLEDVDIVVSDDELDPAIAENFQAHGVQVL